MVGAGPEAPRAEGAVTLYFFEQITETDFVGPVVIAAETEDEAWGELSRREGRTVGELKDAAWIIAQELARFPAGVTVVYPSHYRRAIL
jgi:hypothetical protein